MKTMKHKFAAWSFLFCGFAMSARADIVATYDFNNNLNAVQGGVVALTPVDPESTSGFQTATVFGTSRTVYQFNGVNSPPEDQGGLQLDTTGLISSNTYSVEIVFELDQRNDAWRRILDSLDRQSDSGFYVDPSNNLDVYPVGGTSSAFVTGQFFDVFLTVDSSNTVTGYISGAQQFTETTAVMDLSTHYLNFFLDNLAGGGIGEWSSGEVSLIKLFNTALTPTQVANETADPFSGTGVPEPSTWLLIVGSGSVLAAFKRKILI